MDMTVQEIKDAIRIAEAAGDYHTAEQLRKKLQRMVVNEG
jgi:hypothetical protein